MPKYLMFDHGGVLDGVSCVISLSNDGTRRVGWVDSTGLHRIQSGERFSSDDDFLQKKFGLTNDDLVLGYVDQNIGGDDNTRTYHVLKNGVRIVNHLNMLVEQYGYRIVFHSSNDENTQMDLLRQLQTACAKRNLRFPNVTAMAVLNKQEASQISQSNPSIKTSHEGIKVATFGTDNGSGKAFLREALSHQNMLNIPANERKNHILFDDGSSIIAAASREGYQTYRIGDAQYEVNRGDKISDGWSLDAAIQHVLTREIALAQTQPVSSSSSSSSYSPLPPLQTPPQPSAPPPSSFFSSTNQPVENLSQDIQFFKTLNQNQAFIGLMARINAIDERQHGFGQDGFSRISGPIWQ